MIRRGARCVVGCLFRGFCRPELEYSLATAPFKEKRGEIETLINDFAQRGFEEFDEGKAEDMIKFFRDFYKVVDEPKEFENKITKSCRDLETGRAP